MPLTPEQIAQLYEDTKFPEAPQKYPHGPLIETPETRLMAGIVHDLIEDKVNDTKNVKFTRGKEPGAETMVSWRGVNTKLAPLLEKSDFNHITVTPLDAANYAKTVITPATPSYKTCKENINKAEIKHEQDGQPPTGLSYTDQETGIRKYLSYPQIVSVVHYTSNTAYPANKAMRDVNVAPIEHLPEALLLAANVSSAYNAIPPAAWSKTPGGIPEVGTVPMAREDWAYDTPRLIKQAADQEVTKWAATTSTSATQAYKTKAPVEEKVFSYFNGRRMDITAISLVPSETEGIFSAGTQFQARGHEVAKNKSNRLSYDQVVVNREATVEVMKNKKNELQLMNRAVSKTAERIDATNNTYKKEAAVNNLYTEILTASLDNGTLTPDKHAANLSHETFKENVQQTTIFIQNVNLEGVSTKDKVLFKADQFVNHNGLEVLIPTATLDEQKQQKLKELDSVSKRLHKLSSPTVKHEPINEQALNRTLGNKLNKAAKVMPKKVQGLH